MIWHWHWWKNIYYNKWGRPTEQHCRLCGLKRRMETTSWSVEPFVWFWVYSDGTVGPKKNVSEY